MIGRKNVPACRLYSACPGRNKGCWPSREYSSRPRIILSSPDLSLLVLMRSHADE